MKLIKYLFIIIIINTAYLFSMPNSNSSIYGIEFDKLNNEFKVEVDTNLTNRILQVWATSNDLNVKVQVGDKNKQINITVYNMLGKEIVKVYEGFHVRDTDPYTVSINIPNGIYICVLRGDGFRHAEKFIISR